MPRFLLSFCLLASILAHAQVRFETGSLSSALQKAAATGKLVLLQVESADCSHCNEVASAGLSRPDVGTSANGLFISLELPVTHPDRQAVETRYNMEGRFGTLFLDASGTLLHKYEASSTGSAPYLRNFEIAQQKAGESMRISELEKEFNAGNRAPGFIEALLLKKQSLGLSTTALLDAYVRTLPADSLRSVRTLVFLARQAPVLGTAADTALRKDRALFDRAWYSLPLPDRIQINNRIISTSMSKAAANHDLPFASRVAGFAQQVHAPNTANGSRAAMRAMLGYYDEVKDSAAYVALARYYYGRYFMTIGLDSAERADVRAEQSMPARIDTLVNGNKVSYVQARRVKPVSQSLAGELTRGAHAVMRLSSKPSDLATAATWVERALQLYKTVEGLDLYARLLYRMGEQKKAMDIQQELIALRQKQKFPTTVQELRLEAMKAGRPLTD
ncbi:MAG: hypothetical protein JWP27_2303 [Flaviaesturariibacter sp.]|nr:hypothetical protein [Flaviaesturariibacter sp.]